VLSMMTAGGDQRQDRDDFDDGEPELQLAESRDCGQVQAQHEAAASPRAGSHRGVPGASTGHSSDRNDVRDADDHPIEPYDHETTKPAHGPRRSPAKSPNGLVLKVGEQDLSMARMTKNNMKPMICKTKSRLDRLGDGLAGGP